MSTALSEGKDIGYEGFELNGKFPKDAKGVGDVLRPYDLALVSGWYSSRLARRSVAEEIEAIASHVELLRENGASVLVYGEVADSIQGSPVRLMERPRFHSEQAWQEYADKLTELARFTLSQGVRLAYHHHMGAYVESHTPRRNSPRPLRPWVLWRLLLEDHWRRMLRNKRFEMSSDPVRHHARVFNGRS